MRNDESNIRGIQTKDFRVPKGWYEPWQETVKTFEELQKSISNIVNKNSGNRLVWRGLANDQHANLSSLARCIALGAKLPTEESRLRDVERLILSEAEEKWRMKVDAPEELFAALQHLGAPTRLIDVTADAYIAAWFATQPYLPSNQASRILGFVFNEQDILTTSELLGTRDRMFKAPNRNEPLWMGQRSDDVEFDWGSYRQKATVWFPHANAHPRIEAQQGGFMFDGIPRFGNGANIARKAPVNNGEKFGNWTKEEVIQASSFNVRLVKAGHKVTMSNTTAMLSIRIDGGARENIHRALEQEMRISEARLFPSIDGLAKSFRARLR